MPGEIGAPDADVRENLRALPAISALLERPRVRAWGESHGVSAVTRAARAAVEAARQRVLAGGDGSVADDEIGAALVEQARTSLRPVLNAAGVIVHTNLGRAPLAAEALEAVVAVGGGYSTLEYDLAAGGRGSRHGHAVPLLRELTGAEDACVVNNNAGAVLLAVSAFAAGREVIVSRGELVEIGGGFRVPDVMRQGGARLVEVGTTNRTRVADYEAAINDDTGLLLTVHRSNFALVGFTESPKLQELAALGRTRGVPYVFDAGSGGLAEVPQDPDETPVKRALAAGVDVVTISGDKLLGGPQAGILLGRRELIERARKHPLMRALRPDKLCLAALVATLQLWRDRPERVPVVAMLRADAKDLARRAEAIRAALGAQDAAVVETRARIGGGASPLVELESRAVALRTDDADALAARLREGELPVIARIDDEQVLLDLVAIPEADDERLIEAVRAALGVKPAP